MASSNRLVLVAACAALAAGSALAAPHSKSNPPGQTFEQASKKQDPNTKPDDNHVTPPGLIVAAQTPAKDANGVPFITSAVPEPGSILMMVAGLAGLAFVARGRSNQRD